MLNNQVWDLGVIGARSGEAAMGLPPGTDNTVTVELIGVGTQSFVEFVEDSIPFESDGTNTATILR